MSVKFKIRLEEVLREREMTQKDLHELTGIRPAAISALTRGVIERVNIDHIVRIANALEITDIRELLTFEEE